MKRFIIALAVVVFLAWLTNDAFASVNGGVKLVLLVVAIGLLTRFLPDK